MDPLPNVVVVETISKADKDTNVSSFEWKELEEDLAMVAALKMFDGASGGRCSKWQLARLPVLRVGTKTAGVTRIL